MDSETALYEAALIGWTEGADILIQAGADIDLADQVGKTPVLVAASAENWPMVVFLLDHGASAFKDANGLTVGTLAASSRILPNNPQGAAVAQVIGQLKQAGSPWPPPNVKEVRALKAQGAWPPRGVRH